MKKISLTTSDEFSDPFDVPYFRVLDLVENKKDSKSFLVSYGSHSFLVKFQESGQLFSIDFQDNGIFPGNLHGYRGEYDGFSTVFSRAIELYRERLLYQMNDDFKAKIKRVFSTHRVHVETTEWRSEGLKKSAIIGSLVKFSMFPNLKVRVVLGANFKSNKFIGRVGVDSESYKHDSESYQETLNQTVLAIDKHIHNYL